MSRFDGRLISGVGVFATAVETGSFVRTSELVGLTTSGVSRAIGRLEGRLGVRLFHRTSKGIQVTEEGRRFYEQTTPLIERLAESANQMRACRGEGRGIGHGMPERPSGPEAEPCERAGGGGRSPIFSN